MTVDRYDQMTNEELELTEAPDRLYGFAGDDQMHDDPATVLEGWIADCCDADAMPPGPIEEWDVYPPGEHLPTAEHIIEQIAEWYADSDITEGATESFGATVLDDADVAAAAQHLLDVIASKITYRMARTRLRYLVVSRDGNGEWLFHGEPSTWVTAREES